MENDARRYQDIAQELRDHILEKRYQIGDRLLTERQMAEQFCVGRSMVRDAVIMLEVQGFVQVRKGSGIYLLRDPSEQMQPLENDIGPFELLQARQVLEGAIAGFAAAMVTKNDILRMRDALEMENRAINALEANEHNSETDLRDYAGDEAFHRLVAEATQNSVLVQNVQDLWDLRKHSRMWKQLHHRIFDMSYRRQWLKDHQQILAALQSRDAVAARRAMQQHLAGVSETLMTLSDVDDPDFDGFLFSANSLPAS